MTSSSFPVMKVESKEEMKKSGWDINVIDRHATKQNPSFLTTEAFVCFPLDHVMCCVLRMTSFTLLQFTAPVSTYNLV